MFTRISSCRRTVLALAASVGCACGAAVTGPSATQDEAVTPAVGALAGSRTAHVAEEALVPRECAAPKLALTVSFPDKTYALVSSNYPVTKVCPRLVWSVAPSATLVPTYDGELDAALVAPGKKALRVAAAHTVRAVAPDGTTAEIVFQLP